MMERYKKANDEIHVPDAVKRRAISGGGRRPRRTAWVGAIAAVLVLAVLLCGTVLFREKQPDAAEQPDTEPASSQLYAVPLAAYEPDYTVTYDGAALDQDYLSDIRAFAAQAGQTLLEGQNSVAYSPAALYTALSMVAELADGSSLDALLSVLGTDGTETLRQHTGNLWRYLCANPDTEDPGKITVANSLWLNQNYQFNGESLQNLADYYYVSSFTGDMQKDIPGLVSDWVKQQTNDLLDCQIEPNEDTMAVLLSAIYFYDEWETAFHENETESGSFQTATPAENDPFSGDETWQHVRCNYMNRVQEDWGYYKGDGVTASVQYFKNGGKMLFILPDREYTPAGVLSDTKLLTSLLDWEGLSKDTGTVSWRIPRFTLSSTLDLEDSLTSLGLGELFDPFNNALPLLSGDGTPAYISRAEQGTAVSIDETGCEAASYVEIEMMESASDEDENFLRMSLSRPFVFAILSENDTPLFLGVVNNPDG